MASFNYFWGGFFGRTEWGNWRIFGLGAFLDAQNGKIGEFLGWGLFWTHKMGKLEKIGQVAKNENIGEFLDRGGLRLYRV